MAADVRYRQIADELREAIDQGEWRPDDLLPPGEELMRRFSVSRGTLAAAVRVLREEGLVSRAARRGRLVVLDQRVVTVSMGPDELAWERACRHQGIAGTMTLLSEQVIPASHEVAAALGIISGQPVVHRRRRALLEGAPVMLEEAFSPAEPEAETPEGSDALSVEWTAAARTAGADEAAALRVQRGGPILRAERITRDGQGRPVELLRRVTNGRRVRVAHLIID
ncbi:GntR family transcriptional regulator [Spongiactinospora sp. TRM90649]|uniref:GntR family transcriptional regulator n=1 Tax=Spongiactinospora sp. TRM90649 TaxID=3031114 RepID=UPI0023F9E19C|nr:GntR family transcriptional regulator [Spongiactinospora sp. TRM90649]MDF5756678.1 GntR family transcriptional regulator [Spongiactinospora sp. TRM90649]